MDDQAATAPGGSSLMINQYRGYALNPAKVPAAKTEGALAFLDFLTARYFQGVLTRFPTTGAARLLPGRVPGGGSGRAPAPDPVGPAGADPARDDRLDGPGRSRRSTASACGSRASPRRCRAGRSRATRPVATARSGCAGGRTAAASCSSRRGASATTARCASRSAACACGRRSTCGPRARGPAACGSPAGRGPARAGAARGCRCRRGRPPGARFRRSAGCDCAVARKFALNAPLADGRWRVRVRYVDSGRGGGDIPASGRSSSAERRGGQRRSSPRCSPC